MKIGIGRRKNFFINSRIQTWVMLTMTLLTVTSIVVFGVVVDYAHRIATGPWLRSSAARDSLENMFYPQIDALFLIGIPLFLLMALVLALFLTHRVAGPIHHINRVLTEYRNGKRGQRVHLRKGDYCEELAATVNGLLDELESEQNP